MSQNNEDDITETGRSISYNETRGNSKTAENEIIIVLNVPTCSDSEYKDNTFPSDANEKNSALNNLKFDISDDILYNVPNSLSIASDIEAKNVETDFNKNAIIKSMQIPLLDESVSIMANFKSDNSEENVLKSTESNENPILQAEISETENLSKNIELNSENSNSDKNASTKTFQIVYTEDKDKALSTTELSMKEGFVKELQISSFETIKNNFISNQLNEDNLFKMLSHVTPGEVLKLEKLMEEKNSYLSKEIKLYEFILKNDEVIQTTLENVEEDKEPPVQNILPMSHQMKCFFAQKKLEYTENKIQVEKIKCADELQNFKFELKSINMTLKNLSGIKEKFDKEIRIDGRHPVFKKIILQKVLKYFKDSLKNKMALANRYKIQIQSDIMEKNKILSQINTQEKRLASLNITEFQQTELEHKKSCRELATYKEQLGKLKVKFRPLQQTVTETKKSLEKEEKEMEQMKNTVLKLEHLKEVMLTEKARNDQQVLELENSMRKIKLDPRRHNLPEVVDYAKAKRESAALKKEIKKWKIKVERVKQEKFLHLKSLPSKKL